MGITLAVVAAQHCYGYTTITVSELYYIDVSDEFLCLFCVYLCMFYAQMS